MHSVRCAEECCKPSPAVEELSDRSGLGPDIDQHTGREVELDSGHKVIRWAVAGQASVSHNEKVNWAVG